MRQIEINLLQLDSYKKDADTPKKRSPLMRIFFIFISFFVVFLAGTSAFSYQQSKDESSGLSKAFDVLFGRPLNQFGVTADRGLNGEERDRINVLLLGIGGQANDAPHLTDTIIIASIKPSTKQVAIVSVPRDLLVDLDNYGWRKINSANALGEAQQKDYGPILTSETISKTFGLPIDYYMRVDFEGFVKVVDILGGITINVEKPFTDYTYPTTNHKIKVVSFEAGEQTMDGATALTFVRSRHSLMNNEGSDFARSKRQQKIITALKEKFFSSNLLFHPKKMSDIIAAITDNLATNVHGWELLRFSSLIQKIDTSTIIQYSFDDSPENYLVSSNINGAYVLQPKSGSFDEMSEKITAIFKTPSSKINYRVRILNGTTVAGLATAAADIIKKKGFVVTTIGNASSRANERTVIYDMTSSEKKEAIDDLTALLNAPVVKSSAFQAQNDDFLIILGADAPKFNLQTNEE